MSHASHQPYSPARRGFTLVEMLIVCGIIVMVMLLAIPTIKVMTGGRSTEAGGNTVAAYIARAREEAIALQQITGVLFFHDVRQDRSAAVMVVDDGSLAGAPAVLDLVANRDIMYLPAGVGLQVVDDFTTIANEHGYIGFNFLIGCNAAGVDSAPNINSRVGGCILFDSTGRLISTSYLLRLRTAVTATTSPLGSLLGNNVIPATTTYSTDYGHPVRQDYRKPADAYPTVSNVAFTLYDLQSARDAGHNDGSVGATGGDAAGDGTEEDWLDKNGVAFIVNRYNGTLVRTE